MRDEEYPVRLYTYANGSIGVTVCDVCANDAGLNTDDGERCQYTHENCVACGYPYGNYTEAREDNCR